MIPDPEYQKLLDLGPNLMEIVDTRAKYKPRSFLWKVWNAFSPRQRQLRNRHMMPHPTPIRDWMQGLKDMDPTDDLIIKL